MFSLRAIARAPALHFILIGAVLFAVDSLTAAVDPAASSREPIVITAARVAEIREEYSRMVGTPPTPAELAALVKREADDEMLYREALLLGLDRGDPAVDWRVIEKMAFLYEEEAGDHAEALRRGRELGLQRDDVVVRNGLITKMRLLARGMSRTEEPTGAGLDRALEAYFDEHRDEYQRVEELSFVHVFFRGDDRREADAIALRARLGSVDPGAVTGVKEGDPFPAGNVIRAASTQALVKLFGEDFARAAMALEERRWSDPIRSPFGLHLVWVTERRGASHPDLADVRSQVLHSYRAERQKQYLEKLLTDVRAAYEVRIEEAEPPNG